MDVHFVPLRPYAQHPALYAAHVPLRPGDGGRQQAADVCHTGYTLDNNMFLSLFAALVLIAALDWARSSGQTTGGTLICGTILPFGQSAIPRALDGSQRRSNAVLVLTSFCRKPQIDPFPFVIHK
ncbi:carboxypeptidase C [Paenibacillus popilliae ATCC 14706]|uniref:Carboxypeptidase C n=1 Tax=Paenibacillus popilliae ATCC 14706 TaxID=1212764 RepID=M9M430_PAEPP|nr:carboxypeptidase C [Paenibacillus popilliae ATCC 14706]